MNGAIMHRTYKSDLAAAIHDTCQTLHEHGVISQETMSEFDKSCLDEHILNGEKIKKLRDTWHLSRSVLARQLGVDKETLIAWENDELAPTGSSLRLLLLLEKKGFDAIKL